MDIKSTTLPGVFLLQPKIFADHRGYFCETYNQRQLAAHGFDYYFVQDNEAFSRDQGVLRGLHFQLPPMAQTKSVRVLRGAVYDVVVDLRQGSPTFGHWQGFTLSQDNGLQLLVPQGLAHGYVTTTPNTLFVYKVDAFYSPEHDAGILWNDPQLNIEWPISQPILSDKDQTLPFLKDFQSPFYFQGA